MGNNGIMGLKSNLESIYHNIQLRVDSEAWSSAIAPAYEENPEDTSVKVISFLLDHTYMPASAFRAVCNAVQLRNQPAAMARFFGEKKIDELFSHMSEKDIMHYEFFDRDTDERTIQKAVDLAGEISSRLDRGQIYHAEKALDSLKIYCPEHPDVETLQHRLEDVRVTGGLELDAENKNLTAETARNKEIIRQFLAEGKKEEARKYFEQLIGDNYKNYYAYFPLGQIYLEEGMVKESDYIADLLLNFGKDRSNAFFLKGMVLESREMYEEAYFYYVRACREDRSNTPAAERRTAVLGILDPESRTYRELETFEKLNEKYSMNSKEIIDEKRNDPKKAEVRDESITADVIDITSSCNALIRDNRLSEAYYDIIKNSSDHLYSSVLEYKKAFVLYLMQREYEARTHLMSIPENSFLHEQVLDIIADIDHKIVEQHKFEDIPNTDLADIFFNTGQTEQALRVIQKIPKSEMTAKLWSIHGRCEIENGRMNSALQSFQNALEAGGESYSVRELIGMICQAKGEYAEAVEMYDDAIRNHENLESVCSTKAELLYRNGEYDALQSFQKKSSEVAGTVSDVAGYTGLSYMKRGDRMSALKHLEKAMEGQSSMLEFYECAIDLYLDSHREKRALLCIEDAMSFAENGEGLQKKKVELLYQLNQLKPAEWIAEKILEQDGKHADIQYLLGRISLERGDKKEAVRRYQNAASQDSKNHEYARSVADLSFESGDYKNALKYYTKSIQMDPEDEVACKHRARIYTTMDMDEKAMRDLTEAHRLDPNDPEVFLIIADILSEYELESEPSVPQELEEQGMEDSEEENGLDLSKDPGYYYSRAIALKPDYKEAYLGRSRFCIEYGMIDEAKKDIEKAIALDPEDYDSYMSRGIIYLRERKLDEAIRDFQKATKSESSAAQAYSYLSKCFNTAGEYEKAIEAAESGVRLDPRFLNLYVNRGVSYYKLLEYDKALADFGNVIINQNTVNTTTISTAYMFRGMTHEELGHREDAISDYKKLLKYDPDNQKIRRKLELLEDEMRTSRKTLSYTIRNLIKK